MKRIITNEIIARYENYLFEDEKRPSTIKKYISDIRKLQSYAAGREVTKKLMVEYKSCLMEERGYKERSVNSYLVAANRFLQYMSWNDAVVRLLRIQREMFRPAEKTLTKQEYRRMVKTAQALGKERLQMILQTICATGMRIGELPFVTVAAVEQGFLEIRNKGKSRKILISNKLRVSLKRYIRKNGITHGIVFATAGGKVVDRSNIWREMKALCQAAGVAEAKVFPHNLRHLFAQCFYELEKDIAKLADVLGHSSIETTRLYIKIPGREHLKLLERMSLVFES
ncbi:MAG: tyrosine-type recombinase/integrase [Ruminococcus flavefaciens]|nr:tyrosine-type recombinase/integrase [Ruminococcus flavefaciens]